MYILTSTTKHTVLRTVSPSKRLRAFFLLLLLLFRRPYLLCVNGRRRGKGGRDEQRQPNRIKYLYKSLKKIVLLTIFLGYLNVGSVKCGIQRHRWSALFTMSYRQIGAGSDGVTQA
ncbi:hypothetical protein F5X98DRAFT_343449 [Xylaria grammica]|nr:hypothetical protein F5X98DRAFT_343449 [Xylaria grammica]